MGVQTRAGVRSGFMSSKPSVRRNPSAALGGLSPRRRSGGGIWLISFLSWRRQTTEQELGLLDTPVIL